MQWAVLLAQLHDLGAAQLRHVTSQRPDCDARAMALVEALDAVSDVITVTGDVGWKALD